MKTKLISPLNDFVIKCIYGDQKNIGNTEGFLKTVLDLPPEEYGGLAVIDPFLKRWRKKDKQSLVDIRLATTGRRQVAIELQALPYRAMRERIVFCNDKAIVEQLKSGSDYSTLRQTISVAITNYTLLAEEGSYLNRIDLRNRESGNLFTDLQHYVILELSKLPEEDDGHPVWPYLRFFKCRRKEEFEMLKKEHPEVRGPVDDYQKLSVSKRWRMIADYREKERRDARAALGYARDEGLAEGREEGLAESQQALVEKDRVITEKDRALVEKDQVIAESQQVIAEQGREIAELRRRLEDKEI
jgi:predicted transposase/invertase (TIGR01784 family)